MERAARPHTVATMSKILIGVDASDRSADAVAFARQLATATGADLVAACAFPYPDAPNRAANLAYREALREQALRTARDHVSDAEIFAVANMSPAHALHDVAAATGAALVVVGSTHTGRAGRVLPGSTGEKLLHGAPCSVAVVPRGYAAAPIRRIGVAYDASAEAEAALAAAAGLAHALDAELELVGVVCE